MGKSGCLLGWLIGEQGESPTSKLDVRVNTKFITAAEREFYLVLRRVVGHRAVVLMQVAMNQLLHVPRGEKGTPQAGWRNRIAQKSVDFLLVDPQTFNPLVAIELDEPSHTRPSRQTRDEVVDRSLEAAGLPLVRVLTSRSYDPNEIETAVGVYLYVAEGSTSTIIKHRNGLSG